MFKFCNECFLCKKYYNDDAKYKNTHGNEWAKKILTPFIIFPNTYTNIIYNIIDLCIPTLFIILLNQIS